MQMHSLSFDVSHTLAGGLVLISFMMLYQDRLYSLLNVFALHALVLALSVAWQAFVQKRTSSLHHGGNCPCLQGDRHFRWRCIGSSSSLEFIATSSRPWVSAPTMLAGMALVALSMVLMLRVTVEADPLAREDLAFALSVVLLGLLVMVTRRKRRQSGRWISCRSRNGLVLAATGAKGHAACGRDQRGLLDF